MTFLAWSGFYPCQKRTETVWTEQGVSGNKLQCSEFHQAGFIPDRFLEFSLSKQFKALESDEKLSSDSMEKRFKHAKNFRRKLKANRSNDYQVFFCQTPAQIVLHYMSTTLIPQKTTFSVKISKPSTKKNYLQTTDPKKISF